MALRRLPFTFDEHMQAGELIRKILDDLRLLAMAAENGYGSQLSAKAWKAEKAINAFRSALDDKVCSEHPMGVNRIEGVRLTQIYYGDRDDIPGRPLTGTTDSYRKRLMELAGLTTLDTGLPKVGRPPALDETKLEAARLLIETRGLSVEEASRQLGVGASTLYRYLKKAPDGVGNKS